MDNQERFKRPQPEDENDPNKTVKSPAWQDIPAVQLYEVPLDAKSAQAVMATPERTSPPPPPPLSRQSSARQRVRRRQARNRAKGSEWAWVIVATAIVGIVILIGMASVILLQGSNGEKPFIPTATLDVAALPPAVDFRDQQPVNAADAQTGDLILLSDGTPIELKPWDGTSRFTILAMGIDRRPGDTSLAHLTDTMMLISIDPVAQTVGILSIPRDLWVSVPGYANPQRINTAMVLGEVRSPGSGPQLAMQTVQNNLGIRVHEYLMLDFQAVVDLVDAIGGIEVSIDYTINDRTYPDMNYGYDPFYLAAGTHQLNGLTALKFARTRHGDNDLERARRQQQVIYAVQDRITSVDVLPGLIVQAPNLLLSLEDNIKTGLNLDEMIQLAWFIKDVPRDSITTNVIDYAYVRNYTTPNGEQVLLPVRERLANLMIDTFGENYSG